jgi:hypothetical protein
MMPLMFDGFKNAIRGACPHILFVHDFSGQHNPEGME